MTKTVRNNIDSWADVFPDDLSWDGRKNTILFFAIISS